MSDVLATGVEVKRAAIDEKLILRHLMQLYLYDFTEFEDFDVDGHGLYGYDYFDHYWTEPIRHPYLVRVNDKIAGFALVKTLKHDNGEPYAKMAEFFIMKKYRGQGVGQNVAFQLFDLYPGEWEVSQIETNLPAQAFWRKVIGRYTAGQFQEVVLDDGDIAQVFRGGSGIEKTPNVLGGDACIRGTRIPVWLLESFRRQGMSEAEILANYPILRAADLVNAWVYAEENNAEIDEAIQGNELA